MRFTFPRILLIANIHMLLCVGASVAQGQTVPLVFDRSGAQQVISADKSKICNDVQFYNAQGVLQTGERDCKATIPTCSADSELGCKTTNTYKAAQTSNLTPGNVAVGASISGVTGAYPSVSYPLAGASGNVADLDSVSFISRIKSSASF